MYAVNIADLLKDAEPCRFQPEVPSQAWSTRDKPGGWDLAKLGKRIA